jgi:putative transposase
VFNHLQYPTDVVLLVVLWRIRYKLSLRDLVEMFLMRGVLLYDFLSSKPGREIPNIVTPFKIWAADRVPDSGTE